VSSILDIDLDCFNLVSDPVAGLRELLTWAGQPVGIIAGSHADAVSHWTRLVKSGALTTPTHVLHVDEHHDLMDEKRIMNAANVMYHAMRLWPDCRVCWIVPDRIDAPEMWLRSETWNRIRKRFKAANRVPAKWPRPDFVSVCTSSGFVAAKLREQLMDEVKKHQKRITVEQGHEARRP
jgi:hypothetical protein